MKPIRVLLSMLMVLAMLFASTFSAYAIGFEAENIYESVFVIYSGQSLGSGFAVGKNCIVTNAHVIDDEKNIAVLAYSGEEYQADIIGVDYKADIAVLGIENVTLPYLAIADISSMKTGDDIYAIGAPKGMAYTLTKGSVSAKERFIGNEAYIQIDAPINHGNSGGPLLNDSGAVLGMNSMKLSDSEGIGLAIPISRVCQYISSLGIGLSESGNVDGNVATPEQKDTEPPLITQNPEEETVDNNSKIGLYIACGIAVLSMIGNVLLAVLLMYEKRKNITLTYDPKERTDFEIDFWE